MWTKDCYEEEAETRESSITSSYLSYGQARLAGIPPNAALPMHVSARTHYQHSLFVSLHVALALNLIRKRFIIRSQILMQCIGPYFTIIEEYYFIVLQDMLASKLEVSNIHCVKGAKVPLMRFEFDGICIDLSYTCLKVISIPEENPSTCATKCRVQAAKKLASWWNS